MESRVTYRKGNFGELVPATIILEGEAINLLAGNEASKRISVSSLSRVQTQGSWMYLWEGARLHTFCFDLSTAGQGKVTVGSFLKGGLYGQLGVAVAPLAVKDVVDRVKSADRHGSSAEGWKSELVSRGVGTKRLKSLSGSIAIGFMMLVLLALIGIVIINVLG